jgi:hypothetical protein
VIRRLTAVLAAALIAACSGDFPEDDDRGDDAPPTTTPNGLVCGGAAQGWTLTPSSSGPLDLDDQAALAGRIVDLLGSASLSWPSNPPDDCGDPDAVAYVRGQASLGELAACVDYALACTSADARSQATLGAIALVGAGCASNDGRADEARALYEIATDDDAIDDCPDARGRALSYALFALGQETGPDAGEILARADGWDPVAAEAALLLLATGATPDQLEGFEVWAEEAIATGDPLLGMQATLFWIQQVEFILGDRDLGLQLLDANLGPLAASGRIGSIVARTFSDFYSMGGGDLSVARRLYDGYIPYTSQRRWLPNEQNVHTYTELYEDVCAGALLAGDDLASYRALRAGWIDGEITTADGLAEVSLQLDAVGERAELLSLRGAMLEAQGDPDGASAAYWSAHGVCPYYNRAHWALQQIQLAEQVRRGPRRDPPALPDEDALDAYVLNYASLTEEERAGLRFGLAIWLPYLDDLVAAENVFYAKRPFELLSEAPLAGGLRDERVSYEGDYRLWDDVRGLGGNPVVADISEVVLTPYGGYNLAVHEVAHQVHLSGPAPIDACIQALYDGAAARDLFVNYYAGLNPEEYFAEGVTTFSVPAGTALIFGTNRQWLLDNDPDLDALIAQFDDEVPLGEVTCPVEVPTTQRRAARPSRLWRLAHGTAHHRLHR